MPTPKRYGCVLNYELKSKRRRSSSSNDEQSHHSDDICTANGTAVGSRPQKMEYFLQHIMYVEAMDCATIVLGSELLQFPPPCQQSRGMEEAPPAGVPALVTKYGIKQVVALQGFDKRIGGQGLPWYMDWGRFNVSYFTPLQVGVYVEFLACVMKGVNGDGIWRYDEGGEELARHPYLSLNRQACYDTMALRSSVAQTLSTAPSPITINGSLNIMLLGGMTDDYSSLNLSKPGSCDLLELIALNRENTSFLEQMLEDISSASGGAPFADRYGIGGESYGSGDGYYPGHGSSSNMDDDGSSSSSSSCCGSEDEDTADDGLGRSSVISNSQFPLSSLLPRTLQSQKAVELMPSLVTFAFCIMGNGEDIISDQSSASSSSFSKLPLTWDVLGGVIAALFGPQKQYVLLEVLRARHGPSDDDFVDYSTELVEPSAPHITLLRKYQLRHVAVPMHMEDWDGEPEKTQKLFEYVRGVFFAGDELPPNQPQEGRSFDRPFTWTDLQLEAYCKVLTFVCPLKRGPGRIGRRDKTITSTSVGAHHMGFRMRNNLFSPSFSSDTHPRRRVMRTSNELPVAVEVIDTLCIMIPGSIVDGDDDRLNLTSSHRDACDLVRFISANGQNQPLLEQLIKDCSL